MRYFKQPLFDQLSMGASVICAIHCAVLPIMLALFPALSSLPNNNHDFHLALIVLIVPASLLAAYLGCAKHKDKWVLIGIATGLLTLTITALLGHDLVGEVGEKTLTMCASIVLIAAHWRNYRLCRSKKCSH